MRIGAALTGQFQLCVAWTQTIRDRGKPFDPSKIKIPKTDSPLSERAIGGLGIFFMRKLMDQVEFSRDAKGNVTRMTKLIA
jgi:serine/threonine-protein kinase RsbW